MSAFVEFFQLDADLLDAAAEGDERAVGEFPEPTPEELAAFIASLPETEKTDLLCRAVIGQDLHIGFDLRYRWAMATGRSVEPAPLPRQKVRTADDLRIAARSRAKARARLEAERRAAEQARREREEQLARERRLDRLAERGDAPWHEIDRLAETKRPAEYVRVVDLLKDLAALAERTGQHAEFHRRLEDFCDRHRRKTSLLERIVVARLNRSPQHPA